MSARFILAALAAGFLGAAVLRWSRNARRIDPVTRTWLLIAPIFATVATWLQRHTS
jgi:hypothetical protein